jgi:hypothetical protein
MIWVIGDIHGMIWPLRRLLSAIQDYHNNVEETEKVIFIGDYADHGLNSKEVIDEIIDLEFPKVLLAGNHDDLAIRFFRKIDAYENFYFARWLTDQGGLETIESLLSGTEKLEKFRSIYYPPELNGHHLDVYDESDCPRDAFDEVRPAEKYVQFFESLKYSHHEILDCGYAKVGFRFFHGAPRQDQTLEEQTIGGFDDFFSYMLKPFKHLEYGEWIGNDQFSKEKSTSLRNLYTPEETIIWGREHNFRFAYEGEVVVHGHTATLFLDDDYANGWNVAKGFHSIFNKYPLESRLPFLFSRDKSAGFVGKGAYLKNEAKIDFESGATGVEAINVDTGAVYKWGALTALGLSEKSLKIGELHVLTTLTTPADGPQRPSINDTIKLMEKTVPKKSHVIHRIVKTARFGSDIADKKLNPVFPIEKFRNQVDKEDDCSTIPDDTD